MRFIGDVVIKLVKIQWLCDAASLWPIFSLPTILSWFGWENKTLGKASRWVFLNWEIERAGRCWRDWKRAENRGFFFFSTSPTNPLELPVKRKAIAEEERNFTNSTPVVGIYTSFFHPSLRVAVVEGMAWNPIFGQSKIPFNFGQKTKEESLLPPL